MKCYHVLVILILVLAALCLWHNVPPSRASGPGRDESSNRVGPTDGQNHAGSSEVTAEGGLPGASQQLLELYGKLPLAFVENKGQLDKPVRFQARSPHATVWFTPTEVVFHFVERTKERERAQPIAAPEVPWDGRLGEFLAHDGSGAKEETRRELALRVSFVGGNPDATIEGRETLPGKVNVLRGTDRDKWLTDIPTFREITYRDLWPGVDLVYRGEAGCGLKYDLIVRPGADPGVIRLRYDGHDRLRVNAAGELVVETALGPVTEKAPYIYQDVDGKRVEVAGAFELTDTDTVRYRIGTYDASHPLIIDPGLVYSTFLGGSSSDCGYAIAVDGSGNAYVTGETGSSDFPTTAGAYDTARNGRSDVFVTKLNAAGTGLVYSTFLGGSLNELCFVGIAVDSSGNAHVIGDTWSSDFPTTAGAYDTSHNGYRDVFVTKLDANGSGLIYSTFLGGSDYDHGRGIAVDTSGNAYVTGYTESVNFPASAGAYDTSHNGDVDLFVAKLNATGTGLVYSTFLGGSRLEYGCGIAVDVSGNAYVTGNTRSFDFPTTAGAYDTSHNGGDLDLFVAKLDAVGSGLVYSTFLGGSDVEHGYDIAVDDPGNAYVAGSTYSFSFPTATDAYDTSYAGGGDGLIVKLNPSGSGLVYSTFLGGSSSDSCLGIALDASGNAYVTGGSTSSDFPTTADAYDASYNYYDLFVAKLNAAGSGLVYSSFLGGSSSDSGYAVAVDASGNAYVTGFTGSTDFPTTAGAYDTSFNGFHDNGFVAKLGLGNLPPVADANGPYISPATSWDGATVTLDGTGSFDPDGDPLDCVWETDDGTVIGIGPVVTWVFPIGETGVSLTVTDPAGASDTDTTTVTVAFVDVAIDIKPGSDPNSINLGSHGAVPVAFLTDETFDAATIDPATVTLAGQDFSGLVKMRGKKNAAPMAALEDVDGDGDLDLVVHLETENLALEPTATICILGALTMDGCVVRGEDFVNIVPPQ